jgi:hypothetical protein
MGFALVILTFVGFQIILSLGLNLQWGVAGLLNLAYIGFMATGAYMTALVVMPKATLASGTNYILGLGWPSWAGILAGIAAAGILALLVGVVVLGRQLEAEYFAILTLVIVIAMSTVLSGQANLVNGVEGLINVPPVFGASLSSTAFGLWFLLLLALLAATVFVIAHRVQRSPFGRLSRAVREDESAASVRQGPVPGQAEDLRAGLDDRGPGRSADRAVRRRVRAGVLAGRRDHLRAVLHHGRRVRQHVRRRAGVRHHRHPVRAGAQPGAHRGQQPRSAG